MGLPLQMWHASLLALACVRVLLLCRTRQRNRRGAGRNALQRSYKDLFVGGGETFPLVGGGETLLLIGGGEKEREGVSSQVVVGGEQEVVGEATKVSSFVDVVFSEHLVAYPALELRWLQRLYLQRNIQVPTPLPPPSQCPHARLCPTSF